MVDMSRWPRRPFDVIDDLRLDPQNVRLAEVHPTQGEVLQDLFQNENALQLVKLIIQNGYFSIELPIVAMEEGETRVLEGNRRVAALKGILNPETIPSFAKQIRAITGDRVRPELRTIEALIAPSRAEAEPVLAAMHTVTSRRPWGTLRKAAFYYAQVEAGATVEELQARYQNDEIPSLIRNAEMMRVVRSVEFADLNVRAYASKRDFPITTLERLYESSAFKEKARISFDKAGRLIVAADADDFKRLVSRVVTDMSSGELNSRTANNPGKYIESLPVLEETATRKVSDDQSFDTADSGTGVKARPSTSISTDSLESTIPFPAVRRMVTELVTIPYRKFPNATHDLLRSVLECALKAYLVEWKVDLAGRQQLADVLRAASTHFSDNKRLLPVIRQIQGGDPGQYTSSLAFLNAINHNPDLSSAAENVKTAFDTMYPLLKHVLDKKNLPS